MLTNNVKNGIGSSREFGFGIELTFEYSNLEYRITNIKQTRQGD